MFLNLMASDNNILPQKWEWYCCNSYSSPLLDPPFIVKMLQNTDNKTIFYVYFIEFDSNINLNSYFLIFFYMNRMIRF